MINLLLIFIPGLLTFYRHGNNILKNIPPIILIEIVPYAILCIIVGEPIFLAIFSFLILSTFYEIGYAYNDSISAKKEVENVTTRNTISSKYVFPLIITRVIYSVLFLNYVFTYNSSNFENYLFIILIITFTFLIHNSISGEFKICTFIVLNIFKVYFRIIFITISPNFYILVIFPHIAIKLLHYLKSKKYIIINENTYKKLINPIYTGWLFFYLYISFNLFLLSLPFFINHIKRSIIDYLKNK